MPKSPVDETKKMIECYICARVLKEKFKVFTHPGTLFQQLRFRRLRNDDVMIMTFWLWFFKEAKMDNHSFQQ